LVYFFGGITFIIISLLDGLRRPVFCGYRGLDNILPLPYTGMKMYKRRVIPASLERQGQNSETQGNSSSDEQSEATAVFRENGVKV